MNQEHPLDKLLEILKLMLILKSENNYGKDFPGDIEGWDQACDLNYRCCNNDSTTRKRCCHDA